MPVYAFINRAVDLTVGNEDGYYLGSCITPFGAHTCLQTCIYGTNSSAGKVVNYALSNVTTSDTVSFSNLVTKVNQERVRRGYATASMPLSSPINHTDFDNIRNALHIPTGESDRSYNVSGTVTIVTFGNLPSPRDGWVSATPAAGTVIYAANVNSIIAGIQLGGGSGCTCNCNYCTCNCNYCTCNCNYSCTCNCNYSDERVKTEIEYM